MVGDEVIVGIAVVAGNGVAVVRPLSSFLVVVSSRTVWAGSICANLKFENWALF